MTIIMRATPILVVLVFAAAAAAEQAPAVPAPAVPPAPVETPVKASPLEPQGYTYEPAGRRDPFVSLIRRGEESAGTTVGPRPPGLPGMATSEVALRGTIKGRSGEWIAILQGVDRKSHLARSGDLLLDGTIRSVTADSMVILQRVNDPLSLETQREVRKVLRKTEEAK